MIWATLSVHIFSATVWIGGLLYIGGVLYPVFRYQKMTTSHVYVAIERRFMGFVWMSIWTMAITGALLMLSSQKFVFGRFEGVWDYLFLLKQILYLMMILAAMSSAGIVKKMEAILENAARAHVENMLMIEHQRMLLRNRLSIVLGLLVVLISARLAIN